jgi:hypothetical protein
MANNKTVSLPVNTLSEIPTPAENAQPITGLQKSSGKVIGYQLGNGQMVEKSAAVQLARQGGITGVGIAKRNGVEYLKSIPDGSGNNNLSNLPSV